MGRRDDTDIEGLMADVSERSLRTWVRNVQAGDDRALIDMKTVVIDRLVEPDVRALFVQALSDAAGAGAQFARLAMDAMRAQCDVEAEAQVVGMAQAVADQQIDAYLESRDVHAM